MSQALSSLALAQAPSLLTRLPTVLVHLVMQQLQIEELARLASTCCVLRSDALHPSSGRYLRNSQAPLHYLRLSFETSADDSDVDSPRSFNEQRVRNTNLRIHSPLGRAHLSVTLAACPGVPLPNSSPGSPPHATTVAALSALASGWLHVDTLDVANTYWWTEAGAVALLSSPPLRRISSIINVDSVWLTEAVQSEMCRLPLLRSIDITQTRDFHPSLRLHPSALVHATALRHLSIDSVDRPPHRLAGLACVPALTSLQLEVDFWLHKCEPALGLLPMLSQHCRPMLSGLRCLWLLNCDLSKQPRADIRRFFAAMSQLRFLFTHDCRPDHILRGLIDAGPVAMAELRVVRFCKRQLGYLAGVESQLPLPLLQRFLVRFPRARYCLSFAGQLDLDAEDRWTRERDVRHWDRLCVKSDHAEPDSEGVCADCIEANPHRWNGLDPMCVPEVREDSSAAVAERRTWEADLAPAVLNTEDSLRQLQPAFEAALAAAGPRKSPELEAARLQSAASVIVM